MRYYRVTVHHNGMHPGEVRTVPDAEVARWQGEIDRGFLVEVRQDADGGWVDVAEPVLLAELVDDDESTGELSREELERIWAETHPSSG